MARGVAVVLLTVAVTAPALGGCSDDGGDAARRRPAATTAPTTVPEVPTVPRSSTTIAPLADQTPPRGANGLAFDAEGTLWVADLTGGQLLAVDPASGLVLRRLGAERGVRSPDDLVFDAEGRLWWTDYGGGHVGRVDRPAAEDARSVDVADVGPGANPIAVAPGGDVYVGRTIVGRGLFALTPGAPGAPRRVAADPGLINAFAFGPDGRLYAPVGDTGTVIAIDPTDGETTVIAKGFRLPVAVRWSAEGRLFVLEATPPVVSEVNAATGGVSILASASTLVADNLALGPDGTLYVSGFDEPSITVIRPGGSTEVVHLGRSS